MEIITSDVRGFLTAMMDPSVAAWWTGLAVVFTTWLWKSAYSREVTRNEQVAMVVVASGLMSILPALLLGVIDGGQDILGLAWATAENFIATIAFSQAYYHIVWKTIADYGGLSAKR